MLQTNDYLLKEQETIERFLKSDLNKAPYSVELNVRWHTQYTVTYFDIFIRYQNIPLAVVEFILSPKHRRTLEFATRQISNVFYFTDCHYGIITDHNEFYLYDKYNKEYSKHDINDIISILLDYKIPQTSSDIKSPLKDVHNILKDIGFNELIDSLVEYNGKYYFKDNYETFFWRKLLNVNEQNSGTIYHYTSLETVFLILKNGTYRLCGITGMNDTSEVDYFDKYCLNKKHKPSYQILNSIFVSSCSSLKDNLTMFRLYGDIAKGVCIVFDIKTEYNKGFLLQTISYADEQKKDPKLNIIKQLINNNVVFKDIDRWKHFFKSKNYSTEKEVRLLFQDDGITSLVSKREMLINKNSIYTPCVEFNINSAEFPLVLKEIIIGPLCPKPHIIINQLKKIINQYRLSINIKLSDIKDFR